MSPAVMPPAVMAPSPPPVAPPPLPPTQQSAMSYLPLFNQTAIQLRLAVEYPSDFAGPPHAGVWNVSCRVDGVERGKGSGQSKQAAKEIAAQQAYFSMGWGQPSEPSEPAVHFPPDPSVEPPPLPSSSNPLAPAQPSMAFLPIFNQTAIQRRHHVLYPAEFIGPPHAGSWTVKCVVDDIEKGYGSGASKQLAKEEAAKQAYYNMGWAPRG